MFLKTTILLFFAAISLAANEASFSQSRTRIPTTQTEAAQVVEQMRGFSMRMSAAPPSDGRIDPLERHRQEIIRKLRQSGSDSVPALSQALSDSDVRMRRNAALALIYLGGGYLPEAQPELEIEAATPALIAATKDSDTDTREWAAHALAEIGPKAQSAVPALIELLRGKEEGPRNTSCIALGRIGPGAKDALPALKLALSDPSQDVRRFAEHAIAQIQR